MLFGSLLKLHANLVTPSTGHDNVDSPPLVFLVLAIFEAGLVVLADSNAHVFCRSAGGVKRRVSGFDCWYIKQQTSVGASNLFASERNSFGLLDGLHIPVDIRQQACQPPKRKRKVREGGQKHATDMFVKRGAINTNTPRRRGAPSHKGL